MHSCARLQASADMGQHIHIIGAGVVGLCCALELQDQGHTVTISDKSTHLGASTCSWFAGGMIAPWCESERADPIVVPLGAKAADWWRAHLSCMHENGTLVLAHGRDLPELRRFSERTQAHQWLNQIEVAQLEPDLSERFRQGLFYAQEAHFDPREALQQLMAQIVANGGTFHWDTNGFANSVDADITVDCSGWSARRDIADLRGVRGEMLLIKTDEVHLKRPVRLLHPRIPLYITPRANHVFMIGATMIESERRGGANVRSIVELLNGAFALHPAFGDAEILEIGADVRPSFANNLPSIRKESNLFRVNGVYRHGFLLAPVLAQLLARAVREPNFEPELNACV